MNSFSKSQIRQNIKANARQALKGNMWAIWGVLVIPILISLAIGAVDTMVGVMLGVATDFSFIPFSNAVKGTTNYYYYTQGAEITYYIISMLLSIIYSLMVIPLGYGIIDWFVQLARGTRMPFSYIFKYFESGRMFLKTYSVTFSVFFRSLLVTIPLVIVTTIMIVVMWSFSTYMAIWPIIFFAYLPISLVVGVYLYRYSLTTYYTVLNPDQKTSVIVKKSISAMKGHQWELLIFELSFLGLVLLVAITCGLYAIYLSPYMTVAHVMFYMYVDDAKRLETGEAYYNGENSGPNDPHYNANGAGSYTDQTTDYGAPSVEQDNFTPSEDDQNSSEDNFDEEQ